MRSSFQAVPYMIEGTATPRTQRVSPIGMECIIAGSRAVGNLFAMSLMSDREVLGVVMLNIDLAKAAPNPQPGLLRRRERLVVGVRARAMAAINYLVNRMAD